jgi:hypothetical protein
VPAGRPQRAGSLHPLTHTGLRRHSGPCDGGALTGRRWCGIVRWSSGPAAPASRAEGWLRTRAPSVAHGYRMISRHILASGPWVTGPSTLGDGGPTAGGLGASPR